MFNCKGFRSFPCCDKLMDDGSTVMVISVSKPQLFTRIARISAIILGLLGVQACSWIGVANPFGSSRPEQVIAGARRPPILNTTAGNSASTSAPANEKVRDDMLISTAPTGSATMPIHARKPIPGNPVSAPIVSDGEAHLVPDPESPRKIVGAAPNMESTPALSSVPPAPARFKDIGSSHAQDVQDLKEAQTSAEQDKARLMAEPSSQQVMVPDTTPLSPAPTSSAPMASAPASPASSLTPLNTTPTALMQPVTPEPAPAPAPVVNQASDASPNVPRRGIDIMTQAQWDAYQKSKAAPDAPAPSAASQAPVSQPSAH